MSRVPKRLRSAAEKRANGRCEYCRRPKIAGMLTFHADHIIAVKHVGKTILSNLAWACYTCNSSKGSDVASYCNLPESRASQK